MKIVFKQILTEKTDNKEVIKDYKIKVKNKVKDKSSRWKERTVPELNPEIVDTYYPEIWEMFPEN